MSCPQKCAVKCYATSGTDVLHGTAADWPRGFGWSVLVQFRLRSHRYCDDSALACNARQCYDPAKTTFRTDELGCPQLTFEMVSCDVRCVDDVDGYAISGRTVLCKVQDYVFGAMCYRVLGPMLVADS
eukprot:2233084-Rhodomonas_salina.1